MANIDGPFGLRPSRQMTGEATETTEYAMADAHSTAISIGDAVMLSSGYLIIGGAGDTPVGVFAGCNYTNGAGDYVVAKAFPGDAAATNIKALVLDDPATKFTIQCDDALTVANVGNQMDLVIVAGDAAIGVSKSTLDSTAAGDHAWRVVGLVDRPDNSWGANQEVEVVAAKHANGNFNSAT